MQEQTPADASFKQMLQIQRIVVEAVSSVILTSDKANEIIESEDYIRKIISTILVGQRHTTHSHNGEQDAKTLLFIEPFGDDGKPLFKTQRQMAQTLVGKEASPLYGKMAENIRIFLGQIIKKKHESGWRPISKNMEAALPIVIATRIANAQKAKEVSNTIIRTIKEL